ncbi:MAG: hypothetical protein EA350_00270 [Gemmatimonadales bacterium]|nr:MAG: hypothetical protein EA350_00270 [Gemmatimonadales bacterium]
MRGRGDARGAGAAAVAVMVLSIAVGTAGCDLLGPDRETFLVRVDSISAPATVSTGDTLTVQFHGFVGSDGCHRLERVDRGRGPGTLVMTFHGERRVGGNIVCTLEPVALTHEERVTPPFDDPFTIVVRQPGGGTLERVVRVE